MENVGGVHDLLMGGMGERCIIGNIPFTGTLFADFCFCGVSMNMHRSAKETKKKKKTW